MRIASVLAPTLAVLALGGCRSRAPASRYQKDGLGFDHLAGWTVKDDTQAVSKDAQRKVRTVTIKGPEQAVLTIQVFTPNVDVSLETLAKDVMSAMPENIKKRLTVGDVHLGEAQFEQSAPTERSIAGTNTRGLKLHSILRLAGVRIPHTMELFLIHVAGRKVVLMDQVADEDRPKVNAGVQRIFDTIALSP